MSIMYEFAVPEDLPAVVSVWRECFGDSEEYINNFISQKVAERFAVARYDGQTVGITALVPCRCGSCNAYYIYALCVLPEYRRRGIARGILDFALAYSKERADGGLILHPAEDSLYGYYRALGFDVPLWGQKVSLSSATAEQGRLLSLEEFLSDREKAVADSDIVSFEPQWVALNYHETLGDGGFCVKVNGDYFLGKEKEGMISVSETSFPASLTEDPVGLGRGIPTDKKYILTLTGE